ncbi:MAG: class I SAM-dependent methyltransferase [Oscillospiraceae bacterium]|nr:class I SAM-dependent methyltransferase [Oscillospiraceae bacterium]
MPVIKGLEWTFDTVAKEFDRWSPTYNSELYKDLFAYKEINMNSNVLEIGIGTGQATVPILRTGCNLTAVELGKNLAEFTRNKFKEYKNFSVKNMAFQDFCAESSSFDMIYSAGAFHWIPEELGYEKVFDMLKPGGVFARCTIHPYYRNNNRQEKLFDDIQKAYKLHYNPIYHPADPSEIFHEYSAEQAEARAQISLKYGFTDIAFKMYYRERTYAAEDYTSLISIYSDHIALPKSNRVALCNDIKKAINAHGGNIVLRDVIDIEMARKPSDRTAI